MPSNENASSRQDELVSAAHAAASWVRARRATWTSAPLPGVDAAPAAPEPDFVFIAAPAHPPVVETPRAPFVPPVLETPRAPFVAPVVEPPPAPAVARVIETVPPAVVPHGIAPPPIAHSGPSPTEHALALGAPILRWAARGAVAAAIVAAAVVGGRALWSVLPSLPARTAPAEATPASSAAHPTAAGSMHVSSTPPGAQVIVDGKARGVTPLDLAGVSPGRHEVALQSDAGSVKRTVTVAANATVTIDEAIFSGFVTVYAPFDLTITEAGRVLRADDRQQIMLSPGSHELRFMNRTLAYDVARRVDVKPGESTNIQLTPDPSALTVTAREAAEVWVDGARLGDTPLNGAPIPLGVHEIVVKRAAGGERRFTLTVGTKPVSLTVDF